MPANSQITLKKGQVRTFVNETGDTLIAMRLDDARTILTDVLNYQIADSLVKEYEAKDKERGKIITLQKDAIAKLTEKSESLRVENSEKFSMNKMKEVFQSIIEPHTIVPEHTKLNLPKLNLPKLNKVK